MRPRRAQAQGCLAVAGCVTARLSRTSNSILHPRLFVHAYRARAASADPMSRGASLLACLWFRPVRGRPGAPLALSPGCPDHLEYYY